MLKSAQSVLQRPDPLTVTSPETMENVLWPAPANECLGIGSPQSAARWRHRAICQRKSVPWGQRAAPYAVVQQSRRVAGGAEIQATAEPESKRHQPQSQSP